MLQQIEKFQIVLIKPSKYDDDGYRHSFLERRTAEQHAQRPAWPDRRHQRAARIRRALPIEVTTFDETAEKIPMGKIIRWSKEPGTKLLVCLVGVQTNQFPRAVDMAKQFRAAGDLRHHRRLSHQRHDQHAGRPGA